MSNEMVVKTYIAKPILRKAFCPDCGVELEQSPVVISTFPAQFQYFCPECGYGYTSTANFPEVTFEPVEEVTAEQSDDEES